MEENAGLEIEAIALSRSRPPFSTRMQPAMFRHSENFDSALEALASTTSEKWSAATSATGDKPDCANEAAIDKPSIMAAQWSPRLTTRAGAIPLRSAKAKAAFVPSAYGRLRTVIRDRGEEVPNVFRIALAPRRTRVAYPGEASVTLTKEFATIPNPTVEVSKVCNPI